MCDTNACFLMLLFSSENCHSIYCSGHADVCGNKKTVSLASNARITGRMTVDRLEIL